MPQNSAARGVFQVSERGQLAVPCRLVSRAAPAYAAGLALPERLRAVSGAALPGVAAWAALHVGVGPRRVLVNLAAPGGAALPPEYRLESSASARDGSFGEWRLGLAVTGNTARARAHAIEFDGQSWVRLVLAEGAACDRLERLDVHDASDGADDCWLVLGDELAAASTLGSVGPAFSEVVHERYPGYCPALVDATGSGETPARTLERLPALLASHGEARRVALAYGAGLASQLEALDALLGALLAAGRIPLLARAPRGSAAVAEVDALQARHGLAPGPDLDAGPASPGGELWADAADVFYVPQ